MKLSYTYNPHRHIKIWLSNKPNCFMNLENQVRLIKMREKNPDDAICLIYDSSLLTTEAQNKLASFCCEHQLHSMDVNKLQDQFQSANEQLLFDYYKDEINHLQEGGNLAVASDILRWLSPIYSLGTYSDFDYPVDTTALPQTIEVNAPLLLNIGTLKMWRQEFVFTNNDYIAVIDAQAAKKHVERIQNGLIDKLKKYGTDFIERTERDLKKGSMLNQYLLPILKNRLEVAYISKTNYITKDVQSSRSLRNSTRKIMTNSNAFLNFNRQCKTQTDQEVIYNLRLTQRKKLNPIKIIFFNKEYLAIKTMLKQDDALFLAQLMKQEHDLYLKSIVICTTGPLQIANALFNGYVLTNDEVKQQVNSLSFNQYQLHKAFRSPNRIPMHENVLGMIRFMGAAEGELNDSSWLENGKQLQEQRTAELEKKQKKLAIKLSNYLLELHKELHVHLEQLSQQPSRFVLDQQRLEVYKITLQKILSCFNHETNEFDVTQFKHSLEELQRKRTAISSFVFRKTEQLINRLERLSHDAVIFQLTQDRKIKLG